MVLDVVVQVWQVGVHFKALVKLESLVPLVLPCIFFTSQTRPPEHCAHDPCSTVFQVIPCVGQLKRPDLGTRNLTRNLGNGILILEDPENSNY